MLSYVPRAIVQARVLRRPFTFRPRPQSYAALSTLSTTHTFERSKNSYSRSLSDFSDAQAWNPKLYFAEIEKHVQREQAHGASIELEPHVGSSLLVVQTLLPLQLLSWYQAYHQFTVQDHSLIITTETGKYALISDPSTGWVWLRTPDMVYQAFNWDAGAGWYQICDGESLSTILGSFLGSHFEPSVSVYPGAYCFRR